MIIEYVRYRIPGDRRSAFEQAWTRAVPALDASSHCVSYELAHGVEEPDRYVMRVGWDSVEGHEQGFRGSPDFERFLAEMQSFMEHVEETPCHYQPIAQAESEVA